MFNYELTIAQDESGLVSVNQNHTEIDPATIIGYLETVKYDLLNKMLEDATTKVHNNLKKGVESCKEYY